MLNTLYIIKSDTISQFFVAHKSERMESSVFFANRIQSYAPFDLCAVQPELWLSFFLFKKKHD